MKKFTSPFKTILLRTNAFTIIELLVVIGIISILAVALLVSLNPAEAQRRARDSQRLKDINTLQAVIEQYINDGNTPSTCTAASPCASSTTAATYGTSPQPCAAGNWIGVNFCTYAKTIPSDPANNQGRTCVSGTGSGSYSATSCTMRYRLIFTGSNYEISTMLESLTNAGKLLTDGGTSALQAYLLQIYSNTELTNTGGTFTLIGGTSASN